MHPNNLLVQNVISVIQIKWLRLSPTVRVFIKPEMILLFFAVWILKYKES